MIAVLIATGQHTSQFQCWLTIDLLWLDFQAEGQCNNNVESMLEGRHGRDSFIVIEKLLSASRQILLGVIYNYLQLYIITTTTFDRGSV